MRADPLLYGYLIQPSSEIRSILPISLYQKHNENL